MLDADRTAFEAMLREIFGALDKPLTPSQIAAFWRGLSRMTLIEFERTRDQILRELEEGEPPRRFGVDSVWAAYKRARAARAAAMPQPQPHETWKGDKWDIAANHHLFAHILRNVLRNGTHYGPLSQTWYPMTPNPDSIVTPEVRHTVGILLRYKHAWAEDMRALEQSGQYGVDPRTGERLPPPLEVQKAAWKDCIVDRAEAEIAAYLGRRAAA